MSDSPIPQNRTKLSDGANSGLKAAVIAAMVLVFCLPVSLIEKIVGERSYTREAASAEIAEKAGGSVVLGAAYLVLPVEASERSVAENGAIVTQRIERDWVFMPRTLSIKASTKAEIRRRGIYEVPVYSGDALIEADFECLEADTGLAEPEAQWDKARLVMEFDDPRSIAQAPTMENGGRQLAMRSGKAGIGFMKRAVSAPLRFLPERIGESGRRAEIKLRLGLNGARSIRFLPSGESTTVQLSGDWPSPSFSGYRLPNERNVEAAGFSASWYSGDASRPYPAAFQALSADPSGAGEGLFGMDFLMPADVYQQTHRALRYAILFIIIPFAALFLFEALLKKRIHPLQYALIGLADSMFYLLLLSLAEHMPFMAAYCVAAAAVTALVTVYAASILGGRKGAFVVLPILLAQYAYLLCALESEDYALVIGAVGLFAIVACVMLGTRKIDWYSGQRRLPPIIKE